MLSKTVAILILIITLAKSDGRDFQIIGRDDRSPKRGRILLAHVAPIIYVNQIAGLDLPDSGSVNCRWRQEIRPDGNPRLIGDCENGIELVVTGIDLNY